MIAAETYIAQSPDIACSTLGDETIIMSTLDSTVFMLNSVGTAIWKCADGATSLSRIIRQNVCAEFDVAEDRALADAEKFIAELAQHGILAVSAQPISPKEVQ